MEEKHAKASIVVSDWILDAIRKKIAEGSLGFDSPEGYVEFVLSEMLKSDAPEKENPTRKDDEFVLERLKKLGYA